MYPRLWYYKKVFDGTLTEDGESDVLDLNTLKDKITGLPYGGIDDVNLGAENGGIIITISSVSGNTPALSVDLEGSEDGTNWAMLEEGILPNLLEGGTYSVAFGISGKYPARYLKLAFRLGGTDPSFTFTAGIKVEI
jgi:hypothetical protein